MKETGVTGVEAVNMTARIVAGRTGIEREIRRGTAIKTEAKRRRRRKGVERTRLARLFVEP